MALRILVHSETNRATAAVCLFEAGAPLCPDVTPEQMHPDTVTTQRHKFASRALICSLTCVGSSRQPSQEEVMAPWINEPRTVARQPVVSPLFGPASAVNRRRVSSWGCLFGATEGQPTDRTDKHTEKQPAGRPPTCGCAGSLCYGSAEFAVLSLQGAASALHNGWDGRGDQILYPQQQRAAVVLRWRGSWSGCV